MNTLRRPSVHGLSCRFVNFVGVIGGVNNGRLYVSFAEYMNRWTVGGSQTRSKHGLFPNPITVARARNSHVWDEEGREFIDWISGLCAITLGYGHPEVDESVVRQIRDSGVTFPLPTRLEAEIAEMLCAALGWPETVRWVKTGSEATAAAILVARAATGRRKIVSVAYHGWHPSHVPGPDLVQLPWQSSATAEHITAETAAVLVEVLRNGSPEDQDATAAWLGELRARCRAVGALFIMDEIVTGFRWAVGGATEYLGLEPPDLACFGKGMANGYALGALVGPARLMQHAVGVSSTFGGEAVGLAAAQAVLGIYRREPVIKRLWATGEALMAASPIPMAGYAVHPRLAANGPVLARQAAARGVLLIPTGLNPTAAHTHEHIAITRAALA